MATVQDARGLVTTGLDVEQSVQYESLLVALYLYQPGVQKRLDTLLTQAPDFVLGYVLRGYSIMTDGLRSGIAQATRFLDQARARLAHATERERCHVRALQAWVQGRLADHIQALEEIVARWPLDLLAYRQLTALLFWTGDKPRQLASATQAWPQWTPQTPGYNLVLGPMAFALEEAGRFDLAEDYAHQALQYQPTDLWALHALAHVHEMRGDTRSGEQVLSAVAHRLNDFNLFRGHLWWHLALFRLAQRRDEEVLQLFDQEIFPAPSAFYLDIQNAASLLTRLEIQGLNVGDRWERIAHAVEQTQGQHLVVFTAPHEVMALSRSGRLQAVQRSLAGWQQDAQEGMAQAQTGAEVSAAVALYHQGEWAAFLQRMRPLRYEAPSLGASHAQNDIYAQLMVDAALQLGDLAMAKSLLKERLVNRFVEASGWQRYQQMAQHIERATQPQDLRRMLREGLPLSPPSLQQGTVLFS